MQLETQPRLGKGEADSEDRPVVRCDWYAKSAVALHAVGEVCYVFDASGTTNLGDRHPAMAGLIRLHILGFVALIFFQS